MIAALARVDFDLLIKGLTLFVVVIGGLVALYNARKAVLWKRAELANAQLKDLHSDQELVFACRSLDWAIGTLVVPASLRPLNGGQETIVHDFDVLTKAMKADLSGAEMAADPRIQIYRTAVDSLLVWLSATNSAISRKLYLAADIAEAGYWLRRVYGVETMAGFIAAFDYEEPLAELARAFEPVERTILLLPEKPD